MDRPSEGRAAAAGGGAASVHRIEFDVEWPPGHAAAYLIDSAQPTLVDAGAPGAENERRLVEGLADAGLEPADVAHVVITHPHVDHVGQVPALLDHGARLAVPHSALDRLRQDPDELAARVRATARGAGLDATTVDDHVARAVDSLDRSRRLLPPDRVDVAIEFERPFEVGVHRIEPIHTPGHQADHACYAVDLGDRRALFTGDALIEPFRAAALDVGLDRGAYGAVAAFYRTFDALEAVVADRAYPGHGPVFDDVAGVVATSRRRLDGTVENVASAVAEIGPATPLELTLTRVDDLDHPAVLLDTIGALGYLDECGRVTWEPDEEGRRCYRTS